MRDSELELLYRYRPYRADELRLLLSGGQLRFSDATFFNDPWDCRPLISIPFLLDQRAEDERWIAWLATMKLHNASNEEKEGYRTKLRANRAYLESEVAFVGGLAIQGTRERYRVLCLSAYREIPLMWSHYAASHTGVCQIFDTRNEVIGRAEEVIYLPSCPGISFPEAGNLDFLTPTFLTKARYWEYEREFRVIAKEAAVGTDIFLPCHQGAVRFGIVDIREYTGIIEIQKFRFECMGADYIARRSVRGQRKEFRNQRAREEDRVSATCVKARHANGAARVQDAVDRFRRHRRMIHQREEHSFRFGRNGAKAALHRTGLPGAPLGVHNEGSGAANLRTNGVRRRTEYHDHGRAECCEKANQAIEKRLASVGEKCLWRAHPPRFARGQYQSSDACIRGLHFIAA